ncbi:hypothetical protein BGZ76_009761 [Entomortierella beljakovae]|nr:hypothetical protein BGZ76_009761 [Entomortierella beljakovae]
MSSPVSISGSSFNTAKAITHSQPFCEPSSLTDQLQLPRNSPRNLMSLPNECLVLMVHWVACQGTQDLFPLLCVNKKFFYLVVPLLYRDPFRLSARWVRKRCFYKGVIERQTKLIRTLLLCCTGTIPREAPIDSDVENRKSKLGFWPDTSLRRVITGGSRREERDIPTKIISVIPSTQHSEISAQRNENQRNSVVSTRTLSLSKPEKFAQDIYTQYDLSDSNAEGTPDDLSAAAVAAMQHSELKDVDRSKIKSFFLKFGNAHRPEDLADNLKSGNGAKTRSNSHQSRIEQIPVIWDGDKEQPETRIIPGLGNPNSKKLVFPPELIKTIIRLSSEPRPMINYLSYVTHTDVRSWSAASNMTLVHQILGDARPPWHVRLQGFMKKTSRKILGKRVASDRTGNSGAGTPIFDNHDVDEFADDDEDGLDDMAFSFRHINRYQRWRRGRTKRNKNLWEICDVDFLELLLLFYTSAKMESLSLGMNCSHWYHPSLNVLLPGIPERLSGLRRIVIDHADTIVHNAVPVPQAFIRRHQEAFPGQLREIQVRQSYHYSYDMSKSVLQTIKTMDRLEVLDLSTWTGVFSGLETICTDHLWKLLICHDMDVSRPEMFDALLKQCSVLEELSIIVPHSQLFSWAAERRKSNGAQGAGAECLNHNLPPLKTVTLFGHTSYVVSAFKDVIFAFQDTLETIQVSMYSDMTKASNNNLGLAQPTQSPTTDEIPQSQSVEVDFVQDQLQAETSALETITTIQTEIGLFSFSSESPSSPSSWSQGTALSPQLSHIPLDPADSNASNSESTSSPVPLSLTWDSQLPRLRVMSLRGPVVAHFDLQLLRFCPQLTDLALSYHCSRIPRLVYPGYSKPGSTPVHFPRIMVCDSLAFKWGMNLQEDRRSMVIV